MYLVLTSVAFLLGGVFAMAVRFEHLTPGPTIMGANTYNRMFTLHGVVMIFLFMIPAIPGVFGNFFLPLMLGAKDVAFPKLNLLSVYVYWSGAALALYGMASGGTDTGWTFYAPYSLSTPATLFPVLLGVFILGFSSILTGLNFIVTVHTLRAPGMTWMRMPLFVWAIYATSIIQVLATPVIGLTVVLVGIETVCGFGFFDPTRGGDPVLFQHMFWFYSHPAVYIMVLPSMGVISEVVAAFSRKNVFGYKMIAYSSLGIAFVGFFAWGHHMFVSGQSTFDNGAFAIISMLVGVFTAIKVFNWVGTHVPRRHRGDGAAHLHLRLPVLHGVRRHDRHRGRHRLAGRALARHLLRRRPLPLHHGRRRHHGLPGGAALLVPQDVRAHVPRGLGHGRPPPSSSSASTPPSSRSSCWATPGMPRRYYMYAERFWALNVASTAGSSLLAFGFIIILIYLIYALLHGDHRRRQPLGSRRASSGRRRRRRRQAQLPRDARDRQRIRYTYQKKGEEVEHVVI